MGWLDDTFKSIVNPLGFGKDLLGGGKDPGKGQQKQVLAIFEDLKRQQRRQYASAFQQQRQALGSIQKGYAGARSEVSRIGGEARQGALDRGVQQQASGAQSLTSRGLGNTTAVDNLQRAISGDTSRSLARIDEALAGMHSNLSVQQGRDEAQAYGALSSLFQNQSAQQTSLGTSIAGSIAGVQHQDPNAWISSLLSFGGGLIGLGGK